MHYRVSVAYDGQELTVKQAALELESDTSPIHSVVWVFEGDYPTAEWCPKIRFVSQPDTNGATLYSGPFNNLCSTSSTVIACGLNESQGEYKYCAELESATGGDSILSPVVTLYHHAEVRPAVIKVWPAPDHDGVLIVRPQKVSLVAGQAMLWEVVEEPSEIAEWYPRVVFENPLEGQNAFLGPFGSMDTRDKSVLGSGSGANDGLYTYNYRFEMVSVESHEPLFRSSPDPELDDEGDPSGPGGDIETLGTSGL